MTDKLIMTTEQRQALFVNEPLSSSAILMLDSLSMVDSEPVAHLRYVERGHAPDDYWTDLEICDVDTKDAFPVYTSPQALTPITADDVTDEMVHQWKQSGAESYTPKDDIAAAYNAVIKHRSEAKPEWAKTSSYPGLDLT